MSWIDVVVEIDRDGATYHGRLRCSGPRRRHVAVIAVAPAPPRPASELSDRVAATAQTRILRMRTARRVHVSGMSRRGTDGAGTRMAPCRRAPARRSVAPRAG